MNPAAQPPIPATSGVSGWAQRNQPAVALVALLVGALVSAGTLLVTSTRASAATEFRVQELETRAGKVEGEIGKVRKLAEGAVARNDRNTIRICIALGLDRCEVAPEPSP